MMPRLGRYFWKLFVANAAVMALVLAGCVWVIVAQLDRLRDEELSNHLTAQAAALEVAVGDRFDRAHARELNAIARRVGSSEWEGVRVTFILADGTVIGDSEANAPEMESHANRPEIKQALTVGTGESVRWSHTVSKNMKYVAVRVGTKDKPRGVVRVSMAVRSIAARGRPTQRMVATIAAVSVLAAIALASALALLWSRRIHRVTEVARSISQGDLSARVDVIGRDEIATLGRSLNTMRENLSRQLDTIDRQRRTLDSLVSQLREGVIVAGADGRIVLINDEAVRMMQPESDQPGEAFVGRSVEQCVPYRKLQDMLGGPGSSAAGDAPARTQEAELTLSRDSGDRSLLARAFGVRLPVDTEQSRPTGVTARVGRALILTDVTELTRVMQVKADLAANASHELRTPLSAIRAAVDTLLSVEIDDDTKATSSLIDVIDRHSARMEAMIGDLLELSRLESGSGRFDATPMSTTTLCEELHAAFADALGGKNLRWKTAAPHDDLTVITSVELLRMILRNLIDNAIRFTDSGGSIELSVHRDGETVVFEVADTGCGIAPEDQQRIFERFYQVERARSGVDRGTGLGLSIVRHAAATIGAELNLHSTLGVGTHVSVRIRDTRCDEQSPDS